MILNNPSKNESTNEEDLDDCDIDEYVINHSPAILQQQPSSNSEEEKISSRKNLDQVKPDLESPIRLSENQA